jgi:hypothetical protein
MPFKPDRNSGLGYPPVGGTPIGIPDATAVVQVGTIVSMFDEIQGWGEFIYLPGAASLAAGDLVLYDTTPGAASVTRHTNATGSNTGRPVAIAMAAIGATQFGWYQISGLAIVNTVSGQVAGVMMGTATAGQVGNTADAGDQILNARLTTARGTPAANQAYALIQRPFVQGQIT